MSSQLPNIGHVDAALVVRVYSGRPGCMCGCRGKYSSGKASITRIVNTINRLLNGEDGREIVWQGMSENEWVSVETETRSYTAYYTND